MKKQDAEESGPQAADEAPATAGAVEDPRPTGSEPETSPAHTPPQSGGIGLDDKGFRHVVSRRGLGSQLSCATAIAHTLTTGSVLG